jgi:hypothetical protein
LLHFNQRSAAKRSKGSTFAKQHSEGIVAISGLLAAVVFF